MSLKLIGDTGDQATLLARGALLELYEAFPALRTEVVLGGGIAVAEWVPPLPGFGPLNTADVDLVLSLHVGTVYPRFRRDLLQSGMYEARRDLQGRPRPFSFVRSGVPISQAVQIDFAGPEHGGARPAHPAERYQRIGDLNAMRLVGGDLALANWTVRRLTGIRPGREEALRGEVRIVNPFLLVPLKALAFQARGLRNVEERYRKIKDAPDLYALLKYFPGGPEGLAQEARPYRGRTLLVRAAESLRSHFVDRRAQGPEAVARFLQVQDTRREEEIRNDVVAHAETYVRVLTS